MDSQNIDSEDFINEVRKHPEIWDINCDDYRYPKRRQRAWAKVASAFLVNFENMPSSEKTIIHFELNSGAVLGKMADGNVTPSHEDQRDTDILKVAIHTTRNRYD
ncbi:hypothetical protein evm_007415 [Chilo suppressalis]|nr:hypothetical protein evm_007415 [Chilo suppressalis]